MTPSAAPTPAPTPAGASIAAYGAVADDGVDDTAAVKAALAANAAVFVPAGTFDLGSLVIPAGKTIAGAGWSSWLKGDISIGGDAITLRDLKLGKAGYNFEQTDDTDDFMAERVRFTGGGAPASGEDHVVWLNYQSGDGMRFLDCYFERGAHPGNIVAVVDKGGYDGDVYTNLLFSGSTFERGERMTFEIISRPPGGNPRPPIVRGYSVRVTGCTFAGSDGQVLSFDSSYTPSSIENYAECDHNIIGPGGLRVDQAYPHGIEVNNGVRGYVHHNTVAGSRGCMVNSDAPDKGDAPQVWEYNVFDQTRGITATRDAIGITSDNVAFRYNTVVYSGPSSAFYVTGDNVTLEDNTVRRPDNGTLAYLSQASGVEFIGNEFAASSGRVYVRDASSLEARGNTYTTGLTNPYIVGTDSSLTRSSERYD